MQGGVIGGFCLLTYLLSVGRAVELGIAKQSEESASDPNAVDSPAEDSFRRSNNNVKSSKETPDDLKTNSNSSSPSPNVISSFNVEQDFPEPTGVVSEVSPETGQFYNNVPTISQGPVSPALSTSPSKVSSDKSTLHTFSQEILGSPDISILNNKPPSFNSELNGYPPLYAAHLAAESKAKESLDKPKFSPLFSSEYGHRPVSGFVDSGSQSSSQDRADLFNSNSNGFAAAVNPYVSSPISAEMTRRESRNEEAQGRSGDENQFSETQNSYPYTPSKSDSGSNESDELRSGAPMSSGYQPFQGSAQAYAAAQATSNDFNAYNQGLNPYSFGYPPGPGGSSATATAVAQTSTGGLASVQSSAIQIEDAKSRIIWPYEYIFPHKLPGGDVIRCTRENEFHHFWSQNYDCLVCICLNEYGLLEPVCASCSGCQNPAPPAPPGYISEEPPIPNPQPYEPIPIPEPFVPISVSIEPYVPLPIPTAEPSASAPSLITEPLIDIKPSTPPPLREVPVSCSPLPVGQLFTNPLHPCQLCICRETVNMYGKTDARIECQENPQCVLPQDVTTLPPIPDIPVPVSLPVCEKFPPNVVFPHPTDTCKNCKCSIELSELSIPEQQITCFIDTICSAKTEPPINLVTPPAPPIPIPVEPYPVPLPEPKDEPVPEQYPGPIPPSNPIKENPEEPIAWPPISTPAPPLVPLLPRRGPLPGPSPHDSCRPYPPNIPFQHPWDDCQVCQCSETKAIGVVNVEISCYTKLSCCIESPEEAISAIAGKNYSEASSGSNGGESQAVANAVISSSLSSTLKPSTIIGTYSPGVPQNQATLIEANAVAQSSLNNPNYQQPGAYQSAVATSSVIGGNQPLTPIAQNSPAYYVPGSQQTPNVFGSQVSAEAKAEYNSINNPPAPFALYNQGAPQSQAYAEANVQNSINNPNGYQSANAFSSAGSGGAQTSAEANVEYIPGTLSSQNSLMNPTSYQTANAYGGVPNGGQAIAEANAENSKPLTSINNLQSPYNPYNPGLLQSQAYAEANSLNNPAYQLPAQYQLTKSGSMASAEASDEYISGPATYKLPTLYSPYNNGVPQNQAYAEANAQYNRPIPTTYKPPTIYGQYNPPGLTAEAVAQYNDLSTITQKPSTLANSYNQGINQDQAYAAANVAAANAAANAAATAQFRSLITTTYKPPTLYNPYNPETYQTQGFVQGNPQYSNLVTSTPRPAGLYGQSYPGGPQNQLYGAPNAVYKGTLSGSDQTLSPYNPYRPGVSQGQVYGGANPNNGYYLSGPYQSTKGLGTISGGDQSATIVEAMAQSIDYSPYVKPIPQSQNPISKPLPGYQYPGTYNNGYLNPQFSAYPGRPDQGIPNQVKYAGNYEFNGKTDAISILTPQNSYYPSSGFSQAIAAPNLYTSLYPKPSTYEINPLYRPGQYSGSNTQTFAGSQSKSGEGFPEDSDDSK